MIHKSVYIFDMDGVLVDTEPLYIQMNKDFLKRYNVVIEDEEYNRFIGIHAHTMWQQLKEKYSLPFSVEELVSIEKQNKYATLEAQLLQPIDGIAGLLESLKRQDKHIALASSSMKKNIELILAKTGLNTCFDYMVSGEEVEQGKPAPDIFVKAMQHFKAQPQQCVVIEDARNGVLAAKAAGMYCIGFRNPNSGNQDLSEATQVVHTIAEIYKLVNA